MGHKISDAKQKEILELYDKGKGMSPYKISEVTGVSYPTVYGLTRLRDRKNPITGLPFKSHHEYCEYLATQRKNPQTKRNFGSRAEYEAYQATNRINPKTNQRYKSLHEYWTHLEKEKSKRPEYKTLASLIEQRLDELEEDISWLAELTGVSERTIQRYAGGRSFPSQKTQARLFEALKVNPKKLDDLLKARK